MTGLDPIYVESVVVTALEEDIGSGDITTLLTVPEDAQTAAVMIAKEEGIICGIDLARTAFAFMDPEVEFKPGVCDGDEVSKGDTIAVIKGAARAILTAERISLNFMQRMSGIATATSRYVRLVSHTKAKIVDTRKTTPGLRRLEKYSVTVGGGYNHRFGLSDGVLIKDNHIKAAGGIRNAVGTAKENAPHTLRIEVEVMSLDELKEAVDSGADAVLLDNMTNGIMRQAVEMVGGKVILEASGGVNEKTVKAIAETGVDIISVGALTHSPKALDISLNFK